MFQDLSKLWEQPFSRDSGPLKDIVDIQTKMLERLASQQMQCTQICIQTAVEQSRALQSCKSSSDILAVQKAYVLALEENIQRVAETNIDTLHDAQEALKQLTLNSLK